ncbi:MAG: hypothetical protein DRR42_26085 [Gammaproteobacteria bacterium]|nr:MAG: hypothetical protein DRR42_26085 [Gammaproteobacteria bacterium]
MNIEVAKVTKGQLHQIIGLLALANIENEWIDKAKTQLIGLVKGLEIVVNNNCENQPMTLGELEQSQFDHAREIEDDNDFMRLEMDREATASLNEVLKEVPQ